MISGILYWYRLVLKNITWIPFCWPLKKTRSSRKSRVSSKGGEGPFELKVQEVEHSHLGSIPWGLDRIDQRGLPLDGKFSVLKGGYNVFVYILDSGIRTSHSEFLAENGPSRVIQGVDLVDRKNVFSDETGHGTHVAAIVGGRSFGVAKNATLVSVRVIDRNGRGYTSRLIEGLQWTMDDIRTNNRTPALVVMSLSTKYSATLNDVVEKTSESGIAVITAAGNSGNDSCLFSPASSKFSISVGATNKEDKRPEYSNYGQCLDIYAPGESIASAWHTGDKAEKTLSGTSAACPHVAGTVAILLAENPTMTPTEIQSVLYSTATFSVVGNLSTADKANATNNQWGFTKSNRLIYVRAIPSLTTDGDPEEGTMFLYVIYALASSTFLKDTCDFSQGKWSSISKLFESHGLASSISTTVTIKTCCPSVSGRREGCAAEKPWNVTRMIVRLHTGDILAGAVFDFLSDFTRSQDKMLMLETLLESKVSLLVEPWVVDARGLKYWTAPTIMQPMQTKLPTSVIISISVAVSVSVFLGLMALAYLYYRRKEAEEIAEQKAFQSMAVEFELMDGKQSNLANIETGVGIEYQKEGIKRTNTEINENMLRYANPDLALPTPREQTAFSPIEAQSVRSTRKQRSALSSFFKEWGQQGLNTNRDRGTGSFSLRRLSFGPTRLPSFITKLSTPRNTRSNIQTPAARGSTRDTKNNTTPTLEYSSLDNALSQGGVENKSKTSDASELPQKEEVLRKDGGQ
ncbi:unnamed protein product [Agarophyton chilense]